MIYLKCYGTCLIFHRSQLQYSTEIEKRKENRLFCDADFQTVRSDPRAQEMQYMARFSNSQIFKNPFIESIFFMVFQIANEIFEILWKFPNLAQKSVAVFH